MKNPKSDSYNIYIYMQQCTTNVKVFLFKLISRCLSYKINLIYLEKANIELITRERSNRISIKSVAPAKTTTEMDNEDEVSLPADTLEILKEFLLEKAQRQQTEINQIQSIAGKEAQFEEDWQLSQFWYSEDTKTILAKVAQNVVADDSSMSIALLSCPSLYKNIKEIHKNVKIFEYDKRFAAFGDDFVFYDFNDADTPNFLKEHCKNYDFIIADPPFLSEECINKISTIIKLLQKHPSTKVLFCSGEVVEPWLTNALSLKKCNFQPQHERNLGNQFASYANFDLDSIIDKNHT